MDDIESKLNSILSSPEEMARIMSIARSFMPAEAPAAAESVPSPDAPSPDAFDPKLLGLMTRVMQAGSRPDEKTALLSAMAPYLKKERRDKMAQALQFAHMAHIVKEILGENGGEQ